MSTLNTSVRLHELHGSKYEIASGQPDIRNWVVRDSSGLKIGSVSELIFDTFALKVRYAVVNIHNVPELELEKRTVLVPIGLAKLDTKNEDVFFPTVTPFQLRALPSYHKQQLGAKTEWSVSQVFGREYAGGMVPVEDNNSETSFYEHDHFNEAGLYSGSDIGNTKPVSAAQLQQEKLYGLNLAKLREIEREQESLREE